MKHPGSAESAIARVARPATAVRCGLGWRGNFLTFAASLTLLSGVICASEDPAAGMRRDFSTCEVQLAVQDDRFVVVAESVRFQPSNRFHNTSPRPSDVEMKAQIVTDLNRLFALDLPLSLWAGKDETIREYVRAKSRPKKTLLSGALTWPQAAAALAASDPVLPLDQVLKQIVSTNGYFYNVLEADTGLREYRNFAREQELADMMREGRLVFRVTDPVTADDVKPTEIRFADKGVPNTHAGSRFGVSTAALSAALSPLVGRLWNKREIVVRLVDYYATRGMGFVEPIHLVRKVDAVNATLLDRKAADDALAPVAVLGGAWKVKFLQQEFGLLSVEVRDNQTQPSAPRQIRVLEPRYVGQVSLAVKPETPEETILKVFRAVLNDADWRDVRSRDLQRILHAPRQPSPDGSTVKWIVVPRGKGKWPLTEQDLRRRAGALAPLGYSAAVVEAPRNREAIHLTPVPRKKVESAMARTETKTVTGDPAMADDANATEAAEAAEAGKTTAAADAGQPPPPPPAPNERKPRVVEKEHANFAGVGATYHPGQGLDFDVAYGRVFLADRTASGKIELGTFDRMTGNVELKKDYLGFPQLGRRLDVELRTYSDFEPDRAAESALLSERRKGAHLGAQLEVMRARDGHWLRVSAGATRELVETDSRPGEYQSVAELSCTWFWREPGILNHPEITVTAATSFHRRGDREFMVGSVAGQMHGFLGSFLEFDASIAVAHAGRDTPALEQPHFQDTLAVRGYRAGAVRGLTAGATQLELWVPLRGLERWLPSFGQVLRRQSFAVFADYGMFRSESGATESLAGAGIGLRLRPRPGMVVAADLAHGFNDRPGIAGRTRLHARLLVDVPF